MEGNNALGAVDPSGCNFWGDVGQVVGGYLAGGLAGGFGAGGTAFMVGTLFLTAAVPFGTIILIGAVAGGVVGGFAAANNAGPINGFGPGFAAGFTSKDTRNGGTHIGILVGTFGAASASWAGRAMGQGGAGGGGAGGGGAGGAGAAAPPAAPKKPRVIDPRRGGRLINEPDP